jgi:hypothetical protein
VPDDNEIKKTANAQTFCCVLLNLVALKVCVQFTLYMSLGMPYDDGIYIPREVLEVQPVERQIISLITDVKCHRNST